MWKKLKRLFRKGNALPLIPGILAGPKFVLKEKVEPVKYRRSKAGPSIEHPFHELLDRGIENIMQVFNTKIDCPGKNKYDNNHRAHFWKHISHDGRLCVTGITELTMVRVSVQQLQDFLHYFREAIILDEYYTAPWAKVELHFEFTKCLLAATPAVIKEILSTFKSVTFKECSFMERPTQEFWIESLPLCELCTQRTVQALNGKKYCKESRFTWTPLDSEKTDGRL